MGPLLFLVMLVPFTINGIAVREAFFVSFLGQLGVSADAAFAAGFLFFLVTIALALRERCCFCGTACGGADGPRLVGWPALTRPESTCDATSDHRRRRVYRLPSRGPAARERPSRARARLARPAGARGRRAPDYLEPEVELVVADVRDHEAVATALEGVERVVHFAAAVGVGQSMYEIERYTSVNSLGCAVVLEEVVRRAMRSTRCSSRRRCRSTARGSTEIR